jgi:hypothetical protein
MDDLLGYRLTPKLAFAQIHGGGDRLTVTYRDIDLLRSPHKLDPLSHFDIAIEF